jgi:hypothetical protein
MNNFWWCAFWFCLYALGMQAYQDGLPNFARWLYSLPAAPFFILLSFFGLVVIVALAAIYKSLDDKIN